MSDWFEDEALWRATASFMFADERWIRAPEEVDGILELTGVETPASVLDMACGPGRHCLELARRGFRVTGVDRSPGHLETARRRAEKEGLDVRLIESDMREFAEPGGFELVLNLYTSFGFFEDPEEDRRVARNMVDALAPGGRLVMDLMGKEVVARIFRSRDWRETDGELWLFERAVTDGWSWMENRWIRIRDGERREWSVDHRIYAASELTAMLAETGLAGVRTYGSLKGAPYDHEAERLVVVGRKTG